MLQLIQQFRQNAKQYQGTVDDAFLDVAHVFSQFQAPRQAQGGAALVVYFQGKKVLDLYIGQQSASQAWQTDTMSVCYSTGKGILATLAHCLVSVGLVQYDVPVSNYWPEFSQNSKAQITLRHMLSHQSGLFDIRHLIDDATEMLDWSHMLDRIAQATPRFMAGTDAAYQPLTFGWQIGGVLEKATGKTLASLMQQYLVEPLQLKGAYFSVPDDQLHRVAIPFQYRPKKQLTTKQSAQVKKPKPSIFDQMIEWSGQNPQDFQDAMIPKGMKKVNFFSQQGLQAVIPAANGVFTAESLAKVYAMLAQGGIWQGRQYIDHVTFQHLSQIQYHHRDRVMPLPMHWRLGYHRVLTLGKRSKGFGHIGFNGSGAWCDPERGLSFAYTHNFPVASITGDYRLWALSQEVLRCADRILQGRKGWF